MRHRLQDHLRDRLARTAVVEAPFPHLYLDQAWPPEVYDAMLAALPSDAAYEPMAPPYEERLALNLEPETAANLAEPWPQIEAWLHSQAMVDLMAEKFAPYWAPTHATGFLRWRSTVLARARSR